MEASNPIEKIRIGEDYLWPYLRVYYGSVFIFEKDRRVKVLKLNKLQLLRSFFYGWKNRGAKRAYISLSSSDQQKLIEGKWTGRESFLEKSGFPTLLIEQPNPKHPSLDRSSSYITMSKIPLYVKERFMRFFKSHKLNSEAVSIIKKIERELSVQLDFSSLVNRYYAQREVAYDILKRKAPKVLFITSPYVNMGYVCAAKSLGIIVVEFQHGLINDAHYAYHLPFKFPDTYFPDYLLTYGEMEKKILKESNTYISDERIFPVGHFYLDYLRDSFQVHEPLMKIISKYTTSVTFTGQDAFDDKILPFIRKAALLAKDVLFILIPRNVSALYKNDFPANMILFPALDAYNKMLHANFHCTHTSTCAIEAASMGIPNILIDVDGNASYMLEEMLPPDEANFYVKTPEDMVACLYKKDLPKKEMLIQKGKNLIVPGFEENLKHFVEKIIA